MTILVCQCGTRVNAPGARPGRRGRCPNCGATLLVPDAPAPLEPATLPRPKPTATPPAGYTVAPDEDDPSSFSASKQKKRSVRTERREEEAEKPLFLEKGGLIGRPLKLETRLRQSLLYPLWDAPAFLFLIFVPPALATFALLSIGLAVRYIFGQELSSAATVIPPILPGSLFFLSTLGYVFLYLNDVVRSSAYGDIHHPRSPEWSFSAAFGAMARWIWAVFCAAVVFSPLWWWFSQGRLPESPRQWPTLLVPAVATLVYAQMALVAVLLFDDPFAANPFTVVRAVFRSGFDAIRVALSTALAVGIVCLCGVFLVRLPMLLAIPATYVYCVFSLYLALFVSRTLGLYFRRNAKRIGWFPERLRWGAD